EINRENARKSTGPKSDEGKRKSRANALKHGLRAEVLPLPGEDPAKIAAREQAWNDYYQPDSPAAHHLVNECVRATLLADRCHTFHAAALAKQVSAAQELWDHAREDEVERLKALLCDDPATAVRLLKRTAAGCRWLIGRWEALDAVFTKKG